jgi:predicted amidophosphoribosyltransferase
MARLIDLIAPIPVDPSRFTVRRYSQQEAIARALEAHGIIPSIPDLLERTRETRSLRGLSPAERQVELAGTMALSARWSHLVQGLTILLVDDVVTYGTHFREAKKTLAEGDPGTILGCAVATGTTNFRLINSSGRENT